jgi:DNA-binding transcriptional MerR regulator/DNA gyrase inhibitor GyrI
MAAGLLKINDVAAQYNLSTRTLRYYEEIGLLTSRRAHPEQPRCYTPDQVRRLEQILALRRVGAKVADIQRIFAMEDPSEALRDFVEQLRSLEHQERSIRERRELIERLLILFRHETHERRLDGPDLPSEIVALAQRSVELRKETGSLPFFDEHVRRLTDVRVVEVPACRMARYHDPVAPSCWDSWRHMVAWAVGNQLPLTRAFGYCAANPEGIKPKYGYDVLFALPDGFEPRGHMEAVWFPGGLYAVVTTTYRDYAADWRALGRWVREQAAYMDRPGPGLEELNDFGSAVGEGSVVDLLWPVALRGESR